MYRSESPNCGWGSWGEMGGSGELHRGIPASWSLLGPLTWLLIPGGGVQVGKDTSAGDRTPFIRCESVCVCQGGVWGQVRPGTFTGGVGLPILESGFGLPAPATAALVRAHGVDADGGLVAHRLPRAALIHIWGHKDGSQDPVPLHILPPFPVLVSPLGWRCYRPLNPHPGDAGVMGSVGSLACST